MPSTITHAYMAKDIYQKLDKKIKTLFTDNYLDDYITYSQGPDILFFYRILFPIGNALHIQHLGSRVHREKVNKFFISLINNIKKDKNPKQFIYLIGLVTHYAGDTICHPFVNYKAYELEKITKKKKDFHFKIEAYIDNYILSTKNINYKTFKCHKLAFNAKKYDEVVDLLNKSYLEVFNEKNIGNIYYKSLKNMKFFFHLLRYDPFRIKRYFYNFIYFLARFYKRDIRYLSYNFSLLENDFYLNLNKKTWYNIKNKDIKYNKSFIELYNEVIDKSIYMIKVLYEYIYENKDVNLEKLFGNLSYANGLPIK